MTAAWERQEREPARWYARWLVYRDAGPGRSLLAAYKQETGKTGARSVPGAWRKQSVQWDWQTRAEAWDAYQQREREAADAVVIESQRRAAQERDIAEAEAKERGRKIAQQKRGDIINSLEGMLAKVMLSTSKRDSINPYEFQALANAARLVLDQSRLEFGEMVVAGGQLNQRVIVDDWRSEAIADIRAGRISFTAFVQAFGDRDLATQLFTAAGVPIKT